MTNTNLINKIASALIKQLNIITIKTLGENSKMLHFAYTCKTAIESQFYEQIHLPNMIRADHYLPLNSRLCVETDFHQPWFIDWCLKFDTNPKSFHRKWWEYVTITQALCERGMLESGKKGLGFGVGNEPLPALFASHECHILATDIGENTSRAKIWGLSGQHLNELKNLNKNKICEPNIFEKYVSYRPVDMNAVPSDLRDFDFLWSSCAFEHLGSITKGIDFVVNSMDCLKKGGWAIHTTEFNLTSNDNTFEAENLVLYRRRDIEQLISVLKNRGHFVEELDTSIGLTKKDYFVNQPPYIKKTHLKIRIDNYVSTSLILIIRK
jgi:hypothetical protein